MTVTNGGVCKVENDALIKLKKRTRPGNGKLIKKKECEGNAGTWIRICTFMGRQIFIQTNQRIKCISSLCALNTINKLIETTKQNRTVQTP